MPVEFEMDALLRPSDNADHRARSGDKKPVLVIIADDLTGAADTAAQFCGKTDSIFVLPCGNPENLCLDLTYDVLSVSSATRNMSSGQAANAVNVIAKAIAPFRTNRIYKKIDSGLRGNIGPEVDVLIDALNLQASFIAPALPALGRTTVDGVQRINGIPVNQTEVGHDPRSPVQQADILALIKSQSKHRAALVSLAEVRSGKEALIRSTSNLLNEGIRHILFDAANQADLELIATIIQSTFKNILPVGSAGLASGMAQNLPFATVPCRFSLPKNVERILFVCGSSTQLMRNQANCLISDFQVPTVEFKAAQLISETHREQILDHCREMTGRWHEGLVLMIDQVADGSFRAAPDEVLAGMADCVAALIEKKSPDALFLSGGDTAEAVLFRLGALGIRLSSQQPEGVIHGLIKGGNCHDMAIITKAGSFGPPKLLSQIYQMYRERKKK